MTSSHIVACRRPRPAPSDRLFARARQWLAWPGAPLGKVQGLTPLPGRVPGKLMDD